MDALVHEHARAVGADLALRVEVRQHRRRHGVVQVGIVEDDQRRLAAQLQGDVLERQRGIGHHRLARAHLAGERNLGHLRMAHQQLAGARIALQHIEHAWRQARLGVDLGQARRR